MSKPDAVFRIYLAGPDVFRHDTVEHGAQLKAVCASFGAVGLYPMDNNVSGATDLPGAIRAANMDLIGSCDALVANMTPFRGPSMDPGTAYEMGVATALGKLVVGYTSDPRSYVDRVSAFMKLQQSDDGTQRDLYGMQVEDFGFPLVDNLMMARGVDALFTNVTDAIAYAANRSRK